MGIIDHRKDVAVAHFAGDAWAIVADPPDDLDLRPHRPELLVSASVIPVAVRSERERDTDPECRRRRKHLYARATRPPARIHERTTAATSSVACLLGFCTARLRKFALGSVEPPEGQPVP